MVTSVGIIFVNKDKQILIGHPTHSSDGQGFWTVPKGKMEEGETQEQTAKREFFEESSLSIDGFPDGTLDYLGVEEYRHKKKRVVLFLFKTNLAIPTPICISFIEQDGKKFPEIDQFAWVQFDNAVKNLHYAQSAILQRSKVKFDALK